MLKLVHAAKTFFFITYHVSPTVPRKIIIKKKKKTGENIYFLLTEQVPLEWAELMGWCRRKEERLDIFRRDDV